MNAEPSAPAGQRNRGSVALLAAVVVAALLLRIAFAAQRSLWMDEFHSLFHAQQRSVLELLESVRRDNHPPLSFLLERAALALLGDSELALRTPSILLGVAHVALLGRAAQRLGFGGQGLLAMALLAASSLHVCVSAEARMYALVALAVTGCLDALAEPEGSSRGAAKAAAWGVVGFHSHYVFAHYALLAVVACALTRSGRHALRRVAPGAALAALLCLPWAAWGLAHQLFESDLQPGGAHSGLARIAQSFAHLLFHGAGQAEPRLRVGFLAAAALSLVLAAWSSWRWLHADDARGARGAWLACAWLAAPWCGLLALATPRSGFGWTYFAPSAAPFALLAAMAARHGLAGRLGVLVVLGAAATHSLVLAGSHGAEDYRSAVAYLAGQRSEGDLVVALEPGPPFFPRDLGFSYYARRTAGALPMSPLAITADLDFADPRALDGAERVWLFHRGAGGDAPAFRKLIEGFPREQSRRFGWNLYVIRFERDP